jgi:hypothetical protein
MSQCRCMTPAVDFGDFDSQAVGIDETRGRHGEVSVETCKECGTRWLRYFVEYEAFSQSGRWYRAIVSADVLATLKPEDSVGVLEQVPWYFYGGSYFRTSGDRGSGPLRIDS